MGQQKTKIIGMEDAQPQKPPKTRKTLKSKEPASEAIAQGEVKTEPIERVEPVKRPKVGKKRERSKRYKQVVALVDRKKIHGIDEAIGLVKKTSYSSFDGTVEAHVKIATKKGQDPVRSLITLPAGAVKMPKVAVASEEIIRQIEKGKFDFGILLATPDMMPKLAKVAKILGPKGLMPNPKAGTVVADPQKALVQLKQGRIEIRQDDLGNVHVAVGKVSWPPDKLKANIQAVLVGITQNRIDRISLSATMGPGIRVART